MSSTSTTYTYLSAMRNSKDIILVKIQKETVDCGNAGATVFSDSDTSADEFALEEDAGPGCKIDDQSSSHLHRRPRR